MPGRSKKQYGAKTRTIDLKKSFNWPPRGLKGKWWKEQAERVRAYPSGKQVSWGIPFQMGAPRGARVIKLAKGDKDVVIPLRGKADYVCFLHEWLQIPSTVKRDDPTEGMVVGEYVLTYLDGSEHVQPVRGRFEVMMAESPGPGWLAQSFTKFETVDPIAPAGENSWGRVQTGVTGGCDMPLNCPIENPHPDKGLRSLALRGLQKSPLFVAGITLYQGTGHPLAHLPRRTYRIKTDGAPATVESVDVDLGLHARTERTKGARDKNWLKKPDSEDVEKDSEDLLEIVGAADATVSVELKRRGKRSKHEFSLGEAFHGRGSKSGKASLQVLGRKRQWMQVRVIDSSTGKSTPTRIHFSGSRGEYIAPYGHHNQVNTNWFEDYAADLVWSGRSFAYVPGEFTTDMPVGDLYVEINKGFEYSPVRKKITIKPGQKRLDLKIGRFADLRSQGWVTADTHVHFISPDTAWLEGQAEGVNVVNLLASQWGRLFTNVGDITGRVGKVEDDTIVYVGTENRNHMLGHMSMLGTEGPSVYPMCCGGPGESWVGDPDFMTLVEWARENRRKGGVSIRPHFPYCGFTEDPVPILKGMVDALEINFNRDGGFPMQEWYRYLNCGYKVACCGGTDKMSAGTALGWMRTYAMLDPRQPFNYKNWAKAIRAGRTYSTNGPMLAFSVDGKSIGDRIKMGKNGGTVEVVASANCYHPLRSLEIICNGKVVAGTSSTKGSRRLRVKKNVRVQGSGWLAARCYGPGDQWTAPTAHTSPVYLACGNTKAFDGPAMQHMLALVEGGMEYLKTVSIAFDELSRKRMVKEFKDVQKDLKFRLVVEGSHTHHHGDGAYHTHGHDHEPDHAH